MSGHREFEWPDIGVAVPPRHVCKCYRHSIHRQSRHSIRIRITTSPGATPNHQPAFTPSPTRKDHCWGKPKRRIRLRSGRRARGNASQIGPTWREIHPPTGGQAIEVSTETHSRSPPLPPPSPVPGSKPTPPAESDFLKIAPTLPQPGITLLSDVHKPAPHQPHPPCSESTSDKYRINAGAGNPRRPAERAPRSS